jgi:hypothetical protein
MHTTKKCRILHHLVELYEKTLENAQKGKGLEYEVHFNLQSKEASSGAVPMDVNMLNLMIKD